MAGHVGELKKLEDRSREELEMYVRRFLYTGKQPGPYLIARRASAELGEYVHPKKVERLIKRIRQLDAKEERVRAGLPIEEVRTEHRRIREALLHQSVDAGQFVAANQAADKLMVLDGIAPEYVRVEKHVQQMEPNELRSFIAKLLDPSTLMAIASVMTAAHIQSFVWSLDEDKRRVLLDSIASAGRAYRDGAVGSPKEIEAGECIELDDDL